MCVPVRRLRSKARLQRISAFVVCALAVSVACGRSATESRSEIDFVRNGFLKVPLGDGTVKTYGSETIGQALERKFKNGAWRQLTTSDSVVVEFDAAVAPATLYQNGFSVWAPFLDKRTAATFGVPNEKGSLSMRAATACINDPKKRVAISHSGGRIVIDCRLSFQMRFTVSADKRHFDLRYISLATFNTDDQAKVLGYIYG